MRDNQQASAISRRAVIASLAAGAAANVPAIAAIAMVDDHPDAELLELGRRYDRLQAATEAALRHLEARQATYDDQAPQPRDVMRHRIEDHVCSGLNMPILPDTGAITADLRHSAFYSMGEINLMKHSPPPWNVELILAQKTRAEEIAEEWRRWKAECADVRDATGVSAAEEAWDELDDEQQLVIEQTAQTPATTFAGLWVRATVLQRSLRRTRAGRRRLERQPSPSFAGDDPRSSCVGWPFGITLRRWAVASGRRPGIAASG